MSAEKISSRQPPLRVRDVLGFLAFSHGWTWAFWWLAALSGDSIWQPPGLYFFVIGGAGVFLGGLVMGRVTYGAAGLRDLARRVVDPRLIPGRWWLVILLFYPAVTLAAAAIAALFGGPQLLDLGGAAARLLDPLGLLAMMVFILVIGPLPEEVGWRGYLQDRLQVRWSALSASLMIGFVWWVWHLPLFALPGYFEAFASAAPTPAGFLVNIMPAAILYARVYLNTNRSVLAAILFHFMENFSSEFLGIADEARPYRFALMLAIAVLVVWRWGPRTLQGRARGGSFR